MIVICRLHMIHNASESRYTVYTVCIYNYTLYIIYTGLTRIYTVCHCQWQLFVCLCDDTWSNLCSFGNLPVFQVFGGTIHSFLLKEASFSNTIMLYFLFLLHMCGGYVGVG